MQCLRPDIGAGASPQLVLTVASSNSGWVQVLVNFVVVLECTFDMANVPSKTTTKLSKPAPSHC